MEESDLIYLDPNPSDHSSSSGEKDTDSDTDLDLGGKVLERENLQQKPLSANSKSQLNPRSLKHRSRLL